MSTSGSLKREDWVAGAREVLVRAGIDAVKVDQLARKLRVTRGSFYWHFNHRKDLLDALLSDWENRNLTEIAEIAKRWKKTKPDLSEVVAIWLSEDPGVPAFDTAIRAWARKSVSVDTAVRNVDRAWVELLTNLFRRSGYSAVESFVRARIVYFHQIGYYALAIKEDTDERVRLLPYYYRALTGKEPDKRLEKVLTSARPRKRTKALLWAAA
jgi:AcrR family transcriptional regulator